MQKNYNAAPEDSGLSTEDFLSFVLPNMGYYIIATRNPGGPGFIHYPLKTIPEMVAKAFELNAAQQNVYFACASYINESYIGSDGKRHWRTGQNAGWVKSFWCEIDCGAEKAEAGKGYANLKLTGQALKAFCLANGLPLPTLVKSGGGLHCYWVFTETITKEEWLPVAFKFKALAKEGRAPLVADPSRTADIASILRPIGTNNWKPERAGAPVTLAHMSDSMNFSDFQSAIEAAHAQMLADKPPTATVAALPYAGPSLSPDQLAAMLGHINPDIERDTWWGILAAIADEYGEAGREVARDWSAGVLHNEHADLYDEADFEYQYSDALSRTTYGGKRKTMGTVVMMAREGGWIDPRQAQPTSPDWVATINEDYAWIVVNASIYRLRYGDFIEPAKFKVQFDNQTVTVASGQGARSIGKGTQWLKDPNRRQHVRLVIRPAEGLVTADNCLNEWRGFSIKPAFGNIKPFLKLLVRLLPAREPRRFVLSWFAHLLQHPDVKMHVSLAFWSQVQGVGKNLLFECMTAIIGATHSTVIGQAELASNFNGWANHKVLVIGDEVSSSDRRQDRDKLKGLITGTTVYINEKYQPAREVPNFLNFIFLSNHHDAIFMDDTDRRYFVWEITAGRLSDAAIAEFVKWRDSGGLAALLHFLLQYDLSGFNPKAPAPMTDAKQQMVQDNRSDLENWVAELMASNISQLIGRELATGNELARRYALETQHREPSTKTIVGTCKKHGAFARTNQVRLANGKKVRVLALARPQHWKQQAEPDWAAEMAKPFKVC
jgi:hypothetical protein